MATGATMGLLAETEGRLPGQMLPSVNGSTSEAASPLRAALSDHPSFSALASPSSPATNSEPSTAIQAAHRPTLGASVTGGSIPSLADCEHLLSPLQMAQFQYQQQQIAQLQQYHALQLLQQQQQQQQQQLRYQLAGASPSLFHGLDGPAAHANGGVANKMAMLGLAQLPTQAESGHPKEEWPVQAEQMSVANSGSGSAALTPTTAALAVPPALFAPYHPSSLTLGSYFQNQAALLAAHAAQQQLLNASMFGTTNTPTTYHAALDGLPALNSLSGMSAAPLAPSSSALEAQMQAQSAANYGLTGTALPSFLRPSSAFGTTALASGEPSALHGALHVPIAPIDATTPQKRPKQAELTSAGFDFGHAVVPSISLGSVRGSKMSERFGNAPHSVSHVSGAFEGEERSDSATVSPGTFSTPAFAAGAPFGLLPGGGGYGLSSVSGYASGAAATPSAAYSLVAPASGSALQSAGSSLSRGAASAHLGSSRAQAPTEVGSGALMTRSGGGAPHPNANSQAHSPSPASSFQFRNRSAAVPIAELLAAVAPGSTLGNKDAQHKTGAHASFAPPASSHATRISSLADEGLSWDPSACDLSGVFPEGVLAHPSAEDWFHSWQLNRRVAAKWISAVDSEVTNFLFDVSKFYACNFEGSFLDFLTPELPSAHALHNFLRLARAHAQASVESDPTLVHVATSYFNCSSRKRSAPECAAKLNTQLWFDLTTLEFFESIEGAKKSNAKNLHSAACLACHKSRLPPSVSTLRIVDKLLAAGHPPTVVEEMIRIAAAKRTGGDLSDGRLIASAGTIFNRQRKVRSEQSKTSLSQHQTRRKAANYPSSSPQSSPGAPSPSVNPSAPSNASSPALHAIHTTAASSASMNDSTSQHSGLRIHLPSAAFKFNSNRPNPSPSSLSSFSADTTHSTSTMSSKSRSSSHVSNLASLSHAAAFDLEDEDYAMSDGTSAAKKSRLGDSASSESSYSTRASTRSRRSASIAAAAATLQLHQALDNASSSARDGRQEIGNPVSQAQSSSVPIKRDGNDDDDDDDDDFEALARFSHIAHAQSSSFSSPYEMASPKTPNTPNSVHSMDIDVKNEHAPIGPNQLATKGEHAAETDDFPGSPGNRTGRRLQGSDPADIPDPKRSKLG
jgi:hypothetical protein